MRPFQFCSEEECIERQELSQVSELESTLESCSLPQSKRVLDHRFAVCKYRRSAAGGANDGRSIRGRKDLIATLDHLARICATFRTSPDHPKVENIDVIVNFLTDRLRACQSDATRLMSSDAENRVPASWHACVIRILIWLQYVNCCGCSNGTSDTTSADANARTIHHMRSTAYESYWDSREREEIDQAMGGRMSFQTTNSSPNDDDEMMCYDAIYRICAISKESRKSNMLSLETSWNGMLLEFSKRRREGAQYPLWNLALEIASHTKREEYYILWQQNSKIVAKLPILAKSILSNEVLLLWRYRTVQHYNTSFGKGEMVSDMNRLLGIDDFSQDPEVFERIQKSSSFGADWSVEYAKVFGLPVEEEYKDEGSHTTASCTNGRPTIKMKLKQVAMAEFDASSVNARAFVAIQSSDQRWIFGKAFDCASDSQMGISSDSISRFLRYGTRSSELSTPAECIVTKRAPSNNTTSLSRALASSHVHHDNDSGRRLTRKDALIGKKIEDKKLKKVCRFFRTDRGCRFGDKCNFEHIL